MIPEIIHYCWFGYGEKPKVFNRCYKSWKKYCRGYKIIEWNESNFDVNCNAYCKAMYEQKKWAFLTDYVRLKVVYENGGVYLDTDVELLKPITPLLQYDAYMGFEDDKYIATGLGFGAVAKHPFVKRNMEYYEALTDYSTVNICPIITTELLNTAGYNLNNKLEIKDNFALLPSDWLCPLKFESSTPNITKNTYSIHWFTATWFTDVAADKHKRNIKKNKSNERKEYIKYLPNRLLLKILGEKKYTRAKNVLRKQKNK